MYTQLYLCLHITTLMHTYLCTTSPFNTVYAYVCMFMSICMYVPLSTYTTIHTSQLHTEAQFDDNLVSLIVNTPVHVSIYTLSDDYVHISIHTLSDGYLVSFIVNTPRRPVDQQSDMRHHVLYLVASTAKLTGLFFNYPLLFWRWPFFLLWCWYQTNDGAHREVHFAFVV
mmetsp:Transcript_986/g.1621  ORF Transcript_986/g.1621 Transcript_986/m.1621 type:complete len:170 (-) Transcript_986:913-1422(-)